MTQGKSERFQRVIEADDANVTRHLAGCPKHNQGVCRGSQADVPYHKFTLMPAHAFNQPQLPHAQRFRFRRGANDRVERFAMHQGPNAMRTAGQADEFIGSMSLHDASVPKRARGFE